MTGTKPCIISRRGRDLGGWIEKELAPTTEIHNQHVESSRERERMRDGKKSFET